VPARLGIPLAEVAVANYCMQICVRNHRRCSCRGANNRRDGTPGPTAATVAPRPRSRTLPDRPDHATPQLTPSSECGRPDNRHRRQEMVKVKSRPTVGDVLCSTVSDARFLVTDPGAAVGMPTIKGVPLVRGTRQPCSNAVHSTGDYELEGGRRYVDAVSGLTVLCIRPGQGSVGYQGRRLSPVSHRRTRRATMAHAAQSYVMSERARDRLGASGLGSGPPVSSNRAVG
jgi:hypothetical protein